MANPSKGEFPLTIGGTLYTFVFNTAAMLAAEDRASAQGKDVTWDQIMEKLQAGSVRHFLIFFWAGLQKHHPTLTFERVTALVDDAGGPDGLFAMVKAAQTATTPDQADLAELRPRQAQPKTRSRGARSTSTRASLA
jgi:hypothetical protein